MQTSQHSITSETKFVTPACAAAVARRTATAQTFFWRGHMSAGTVPKSATAAGAMFSSTPVAAASFTSATCTPTPSSLKLCAARRICTLWRLGGSRAGEAPTSSS